MSFGGSAHLAFLGASGRSTFRGLRSAATSMVKASHRPSGDQARPRGDSVKLLMAAVTPFAIQYMNSWVDPSAARARYAMRVPSGDQRGAALDGALDRVRSFLPSTPTSQIVPRGLSVLMSKPMRT